MGVALFGLGVAPLGGLRGSEPPTADAAHGRAEETRVWVSVPTGTREVQALEAAL